MFHWTDGTYNRIVSKFRDRQFHGHLHIDTPCIRCRLAFFAPKVHWQSANRFGIGWILATWLNGAKVHNYHNHPKVFFGLEKQLQCFLRSHRINAFVGCECTEIDEAKIKRRYKQEYFQSQWLMMQQMTLLGEFNYCFAQSDVFNFGVQFTFGRMVEHNFIFFLKHKSMRKQNKTHW